MRGEGGAGSGHEVWGEGAWLLGGSGGGRGEGEGVWVDEMRLGFFFPFGFFLFETGLEGGFELN